MMQIVGAFIAGAFTAGAAWGAVKMEVRHIAGAAKRAHARLDAVEDALAGAGIRVVHAIERVA